MSVTKSRPRAYSVVGLCVLAGGLVASTAACSPSSTTPGDYWIDTVEETQGVQSLGLVPLIANRTTFVRVTVRGNPSSAGVMPSVSASMTVDGASYAPINSATLVAARSNGQAGPQGLAHWSLNDSFVFQLQAGATTSGDHTAHVALASADGSPAPSPQPTSAVADKARDVQLHFGPSLDMQVYGVTYGYTNVPDPLQSAQHLGGTVWPARDRTAFDRMTPLATNVLPL